MLARGRAARRRPTARRRGARRFAARGPAARCASCRRRRSTTTRTTTTCSSATTARVCGPDRLRRPLPRAARLRPRGRVRLRDDRARRARREVLPLVAGYHEVAPLGPDELALLPDLIRTRLAMSIAMAARQRADHPDNDYLLISQEAVAGAAGGSARCRASSSSCACARLRLEAVPTRARGPRASSRSGGAGPVVRRRRSRTRRCSTGLPDDRRRRAAGRRAGARPLPRGPRRLRLRGVRGRAARRAAHPAPRRRPLPRRRRAGPRAARRRRARPRVPPGARATSAASSCSTTRPPTACRFYTLYGHLVAASCRAPGARRALRRGDEVGRLGDEPENGGWPPHLHLQLLMHRPRRAAATSRRRHARRARPVGVGQPDPNLLLGPAGRRPRRPAAPTASAARRPPHHALAARSACPTRSRCRSCAARARTSSTSDGRALPRPRQQRRHVGHAHPRVVARGGRADGAAEHQHALPARPARRATRAGSPRRCRTR